MTGNFVTKPLSHLNKRYGGSVYIGVATADIVVGAALRSIHNLRRRPGDSTAIFHEHTKGMDAREAHVRAFLDSRHDWILFLDGDMFIPPGALERLRSHGFPCVSAHYLRRTMHPVIPIWYEEESRENGWRRVWPFMPFRPRPEKGRLYRLAATGFGCWLVHREVLEKVQPVLCGERFVWEDHMAFWPQTLADRAAGLKPKPLRLAYDTIGADLRLSFFIRHVGYTIWGDPAVDCGHYVNMPLDLSHRNLGKAFDEAFSTATTDEIADIRQGYKDDEVRAMGGVG